MPPAVVGFSDLPTEALDKIARGVGPLDNFHCSAVCRSWRRALRATRLSGLDEPHRPHDIYLHGGVVEVSPIHRHEDARSVRTVMNGGKLWNHTHLTVIGCSYGWIVAAYRMGWDGKPGICLVDPFTGRRFTLPSFTDSSRGTYKQQEELKAELRSREKPMFTSAALAPGRRLGTYAVMLIHSGGQGLSFLKSGSKSSWKTVRTPKGTQYVDVVFHKGAFCTLSSFGEVNAWVPDGGGGMKTRRLTDRRPEQLVWAVLAESASRDSLLMVSTMERPLYSDDRKLYEVSRCDERDRRWYPVKDLGETAILAGGQCSLCVSTSTRGRPQTGPPRSNHIYFASYCKTSSSGYDWRNPNEYRMPTASTQSSTYREISGWTWFLPYVARLDP
jgi:hypothetical protein